MHHHHSFSSPDAVAFAVSLGFLGLVILVGPRGGLAQLDWSSFSWDQPVCLPADKSDQREMGK